MFPTVIARQQSEFSPKLNTNWDTLDVFFELLVELCSVDEYVFFQKRALVCIGCSDGAAAPGDVDVCVLGHCSTRWDKLENVC